MGALRERMAVDLRLHGMSPVTQDMYLGCVHRFAAYHHRAPTRLGAAEVRAFLDHLVHERHLSRSTHVAYVAALQFLYRVTLDRPWVIQRIPYSRRGPERVPEVLSPGEVAQLLGAVRSLKDRAMVMVAYGAGLRVSELCALTAADIDSARMLIRVGAGKGDQDQSVMLSPRLLAALRAYWRQRPPHGPVPLPESPAGPAALVQSGLAYAPPRASAGRVAQTRDAACPAAQFRHALARSGDRHPRDSSPARPPLAAHDGAVRAGRADAWARSPVPSTRWPCRRRYRLDGIRGPAISSFIPTSTALSPPGGSPPMDGGGSPRCNGICSLCAWRARCFAARCWPRSSKRSAAANSRSTARPSGRSPPSTAPRGSSTSAALGGAARLFQTSGATRTASNQRLVTITPDEHDRRLSES